MCNFFHLDRDKTISKNAIKDLFCNLPIQAVSKSDDSILLTFDAINKLNKGIKRSLVNEMLAYEKCEIEKLQNFFDPPVIIGDELTINKNNCWEILKDEKLPFEVKNSDSGIPIVKRTEEIEQQNVIQNSLFVETEHKKDNRDFKTVNNLVEEGTHELIQTITNPD